jgi:hypothetical protein
VLNNGGDLNIGIKDYMMYEGYSYKFVPIRNSVKTLNAGIVDTDELYDNLKNKYSFAAVSRKDYYVDYQNIYTDLGVMSLRNMLTTAANAFIKAGENGRAEEVLDMCQNILDPSSYPYDNSIYGWSSNTLIPIEMVRDYYKIGRNEKARKLSDALTDQLLQSVRFYLSMYDVSKDDFEYSCNMVLYLSNVIKQSGDEEYASKIEKRLNDMLSQLTGSDKS